MSLIREIEDQLQTIAKKEGCSLSQAPAATQQWLEAKSRLSAELSTFSLMPGQAKIVTWASMTYGISNTFPSLKEQRQLLTEDSL